MGTPLLSSVAVAPDLSSQPQRKNQSTRISQKADNRNAKDNRLDFGVVHPRGANEQSGDDNRHGHAVDNAANMAKHLFGPHNLGVDL